MLEDGRGQVLFEHNSLLLLAEQARTILRKKKAQIVARVATRSGAPSAGAFEEKLDAMVVEGEEVLTHCRPAACGVGLIRASAPARNGLRLRPEAL